MICNKTRVTPSVDHIVYRTGFYSNAALEILQNLDTPETSYEVWYKKCPTDMLEWKVRREYDTNEVIFYAEHKSYYPYFDDHFEDYTEKFINGLKKCLVRKLKIRLLLHPIVYFKYKFLHDKNADFTYQAYVRHDWQYSFAIKNTDDHFLSSSMAYVCDLKTCSAFISDIINMIDYFNGDESAKDRINSYIVKGPLNPLEEQAKIAYKEDLIKIFKCAPINNYNGICSCPGNQLKIFMQKYLEVAENWRGTCEIIDEQISETILALNQLSKKFYDENLPTTILEQCSLFLGELLK